MNHLKSTQLTGCVLAPRHSVPKNQVASIKALHHVGYQQGQTGVPWLQAPTGLHDADWPQPTPAH